MANKQINAYTAASSIDGSADQLLIDPNGTGAYKKINRNTLLGVNTPLGLTDVQSPTNKTFDNTTSLTIKDGSLTIQNTAATTKQAVFSLSSITAGQTRTITVPDSNLTLVGTTVTQTLTGKTISGASNTLTVREADLSIADNTTANASTSAHGFLLKLNNTATTYMDGTGAWSTPSSIGYAISTYSGLLSNIADATTYYWGAANGAGFQPPTTTGGLSRLYIPKAGTLKVVYGYINMTGATPGTAEQSTISIRLNNTTDTTITSTLDMSGTPSITFNNTALAVSVARGDYIEYKWVTPTWATNPSSFYMSTIAYIE